MSVGSTSWLDEVRRQLAAAGIPAARRKRIVSELEDHLASDPSAVERLGDPAELARRFADEVGTALTRRAGFAVFIALAPLGLMFGVLFALLGPAGYAASKPNFVGAAVVLGAQLAFVGGTLALLRAWRTRRELVVTAAQAGVLLRRAALGVAGGALTVGGIAAGAESAAGVASWFAPLAYSTAAVGAMTLAAAGLALGRAYRLRPVAVGPATGDLESDLGPLVPSALRGNTWRLAFAIAGLVAVCVAVAGVIQNDPFDGIARALFDGLACLAGFALLGRFLGMRS
jgi:hypothetical protein